MVDLVSLTEGKTHLRITNSNADADIALKITIASEILMDYLKRAEPPEEWATADSPVTYVVPALVKGACLLILGELYMNREASVANVLPERLCALLERYRDPSFA
jgi:hypothetical protein